MANEPIDPFDFFGLFKPTGRVRRTGTSLTLQQVLDTMDQVNANLPIWLARPKGRLHIAQDGMLPHGTGVLVFQPPEPVAGLPGVEPTVVVCPVLYLRLKAAARSQGAAITDQEIASWFYYRAESEQIERRGTVPWRMLNNAGS